MAGFLHNSIILSYVFLFGGVLGQLSKCCSPNSFAKPILPIFLWIFWECVTFFWVAAILGGHFLYSRGVRSWDRLSDPQPLLYSAQAALEKRPHQTPELWLIWSASGSNFRKGPDLTGIKNSSDTG